jgi:cell division protein FtsZ
METKTSRSIPQKEFKIKILGVGGAGCNAVTHLAHQQLPGISFAVLNTDAGALAQSPVEPQLVLGAKSMRGLGTGGDTERGRAAAEQDAASIRALCQTFDLVVLVAGLGGGTGTGASPVIARIARDCGALVLGIALMPFDFEGMRRQRQALAGLEDLKSNADGVICLPNQKLLKLVDPAVPFAEGLKAMNDFVAEVVRSIWTLIAKPGIVPMGFANLCAVTQNRHGESCFAIGRGRGEQRARQAVEQAITHPLVEGGSLLGEATTVLVSIVAGAGLSMAEVHQVMERLSRAADSAHIIMGAAIDESLGDALTVTLIAARSEMGEGAPSRLSAIPHGNESDAEEDVVGAPTTAVPRHSRQNTPPIAPEKSGPTQIARARKPGRMRQGQLPLEIFSRGRFEKSEPTIHHGQDLDVPTYIRRGVALN